MLVIFIGIVKKKVILEIFSFFNLLSKVGSGDLYCLKAFSLVHRKLNRTKTREIIVVRRITKPATLKGEH